MQEVCINAVESPFLRPKAAAAFLGYTEKTLATYRSRGTGPTYIKKGKRVLYRRDDLLAFITEGAIVKTKANQPGVLLSGK